MQGQLVFQSEDFGGMAASSSSRRQHSQEEKHSESEPIWKCATESTDLDVGKWSTLDDHLKEKIIARLPFKSLFQTASLSKAWRSRLTFRSPTFEREVQSSSSAWQSYAPVLVSSKKVLIGYERCSKRWHRLPPHTSIQSGMSQKQRWWLRAAYGSLLCWVAYAPRLHGILCVTNPLTRSLRELPRPNMRLPFNIVQIVCEGKKAYNVILGKLIRSLDQTWIFEMEIFHSTSATWIVESYNTEQGKNYNDWGRSTILDGVVYMVLYNNVGRPAYLMSFDMNQKIWKKSAKLNDIQIFVLTCSSDLVVCGSNVMLVIGGEAQDYRETPKVLKVWAIFRLEVATGSVVELSRAPKELSRNLSWSSQVSSQGNCIYIVDPHLSNQSIVFDLRSQEWNCIPSPGESLGGWFSIVENGYWTQTLISYNPGLCPFLKV